MILDGKKVAEATYAELKQKIGNLALKPNLVVLQLGSNSVSNIYVNEKRKAAHSVGMGFEVRNLDERMHQKDLEFEMQKLNEDAAVSAYIIQLPLPSHIDVGRLVAVMNPLKDADGFTLQNIGKLFYGDSGGLCSCTPKGIKRLLDEYGIDLQGKHVTIIGKSNIVGKPLSLLFMNHEATVTVCSIATPDIKEHTLRSQIIVCAAGVPSLITKDMVTPGSVIIDVGINRVGSSILGDCDFEGLEKDNMITPVPGGVGPMTVAMLIENVYLAHIGKKGVES